MRDSGPCNREWLLIIEMPKKREFKSGLRSPHTNTALVIPFYTGENGTYSPEKRIDGPDIYKAVATYYKSLEESSHRYAASEMGNCFAVQLARHVLDSLADHPSPVKADARLSEDFYESVADKIKKISLFDEINNDEDILLIHLKQMVSLLKSSGIISVKNRKVSRIEDDISTRSLYFLLINSFWNRVSWEDIFPSNDEAARALHADRTIMRDLLLRQKKRVFIHKLANEFFEMTGFAAENDLMSISFLDFYLFSWLKHFNVIRYIESSSSYAVSIELTDMGSRLLASLNN